MVAGAKSPCLIATIPGVSDFNRVGRQGNSDAGRVVDNDARLGERRDLPEERDDVVVGNLGYERRHHHRDSAQRASKLGPFTDDAQIGIGAAQHQWNAILYDIDRMAKQIRALGRCYCRKFTIGSADQDAVIAEMDDALDILRQGGQIECSVF